ncbi:MAG: HAMP domain-containing histidine kinase [Candidatus Nomurabacteria bacterium]|jgi:K+-sensing histidine kinase KdpD|nr:HAMP domain-containing histidine kinase [Candidatus Nomurabacteria bacterium]
MSDGGEINKLLKVDSSLVAVAHELKSPLALIRQLSLFLDEATNDTREQREVIVQLGLASDRALRLVTDLTKAARLQDAMFELMPVNPYQVCDDVLRQLSPIQKLKHAKVRRSYRSKVKLVVANRDLLSNLLYGFCDNALHYASASYAPELFVHGVGEKVRVGVRDHGPSLPTKVWREVKRQGDLTPQPVSNRPTSSGLGLYVAQSFAQAMNSQLGVIRHRDGVSFYVDLPVSTQLSLLL